MPRNYLLPLPKTIGPRSSAAAIATAFTVGAAWYKNTSRCESSNAVKKGAGQKENELQGSFRIESHLMDKIQQKLYLADAKDAIPSTLRILAIDVPEMRTKAFTGDCIPGHDKVFLDDVARPKAVDMIFNDADEGKKKQKIEIAQKTLARHIVHCSSRESQQLVGVELLEASISNLNRYKVRKKQSFGNYTYDPGKYYDSTSNEDEGDQTGEDKMTLDKDKSDEIEAPWNQYAWMEELRLRINGHIEFDAPVEKSSKLERLLFGNNYKTTVPAVFKVMDLFMPFAFARSDPDGIDGRNQSKVRACNKPHAVIANGAALQLAPTSLRLLQKICKKANVPLFVVHDPRQWGGNTQASLEEALIAMRSTVKNRIIGNALKQQGSSAFTRGRVLGQIETEAKWQLKDKTKRTRELLGMEGGRRRKAEKEDWSVHDSKTLENKLIERKVIRVETSGSYDDAESKTYTPEMVEIARECIKNQKGDVVEPQESISTEE